MAVQKFGILDLVEIHVHVHVSTFNSHTPQVVSMYIACNAIDRISRHFATFIYYAVHAYSDNSYFHLHVALLLGSTIADFYLWGYETCAQNIYYRTDITMYYIMASE